MIRKIAVAAIAALMVSGAVAGAPCSVEVLFTSPPVDQTIEQAIIREIDAAGEQILIAMYSFSSDALGDAVIRAHQRGVDVYVLLDQAQGGSDTALERSKLETAGIATAVEQRPGLLHHKFVVIDQQKVITGSYDWAGEDNFENVVVINCEEVALRFVDEFEHIANDLLGLGWFEVIIPAATAPGDPCLECLAKINDSTREDFAECTGVDTYLAFRLETYIPYYVYYCSRAAIETVLLGVPGLELELAIAIVDCICEDLLR